MKRALFFLLSVLLPVMAVADGGVFVHRTAFAKSVSIPDQRALICWSNGVERLAIETRFVGDGTNFAWVVPVPAKPVIEEATVGVFNTLEYLFRPSVVHEVSPYYAILLVCAGVAYLMLTVRRNSPPQVSHTLISFGITIALLPISACAGIIVLPLLLFTINRIRAGTERWWAIPLVFIPAFIIGGMMLVTLGTAGSRAATTGVSVLSRKTVGVYDTSTLAATNAGALINWLHENDYVLPEGAGAVVSNYVRRGWVFVAAKVLRDATNDGASSPHPLCFTFPSVKPVYPMQLTGIGNSNLHVELFVFGPGRATARDFRIERCATATVSEPVTKITWRMEEPREIPVVHPLLRTWVSVGAVATRLVGNLGPAEMARDIEIEWLPFSETRDRVYSRMGAALLALNTGVGTFAAGLMIACLIAAFREKLQMKIPRIAGWLAICGIVVAGTTFLAAPKTEIRLVSLPIVRSRMNLMQIANQFAADAQSNETNSISISASRTALEPTLEAFRFENYVLGGSVREEDSPGNYMLRQTSNGVEFVWFDVFGGEHLEKP